MRLTEFWARMDEHLGPTRARAWAETQVIRELDGLTVTEALAAGYPTKQVWLAVWAYLDLPASAR